MKKVLTLSMLFALVFCCVAEASSHWIMYSVPMDGSMTGWMAGYIVCNRTSSSVTVQMEVREDDGDVGTYSFALGGYSGVIDSCNSGLVNSLTLQTYVTDGILGNSKCLVSFYTIVSSEEVADELDVIGLIDYTDSSNDHVDQLCATIIDSDDTNGTQTFDLSWCASSECGTWWTGVVLMCYEYDGYGANLDAGSVTMYMYNANDGTLLDYHTYDITGPIFNMSVTDMEDDFDFDSEDMDGPVTFKCTYTPPSGKDFRILAYTLTCDTNNNDSYGHMNISCNGR